LEFVVVASSVICGQPRQGPSNDAPPKWECANGSEQGVRK
jgi:hypothetical protein